jgi:hypothetical protein
MMLAGYKDVQYTTEKKPDMYKDVDSVGKCLLLYGL